MYTVDVDFHIMCIYYVDILIGICFVFQIYIYVLVCVFLFVLFCLFVFWYEELGTRLRLTLSIFAIVDVGQISSRPHTTDFPQMVVNCKGNLLFQGNLLFPGW